MLQTDSLKIFIEILSVVVQEIVSQYFPIIYRNIIVRVKENNVKINLCHRYIIIYIILAKWFENKIIICNIF